MAKKPTTKKAAPKKVVAKKAAPKKVVAKKAVKAETKKSVAPAKAPKNNQIDAFRKSAIGLNWSKDHLIREAKAIFGAGNVKVDALNNTQVAFDINGTRVPSDGYFSVK